MLIKTDPKAFTLLEVMIVLAILAAFVTLALPRLGNRNYEVKSNLRRLSVLSKELRSLAKIRNSVYRLVIRMDNEDPSERVNEYWVEVNTQKDWVPPEEIEEQPFEEEEEEDSEEGPPKEFQIADRITSKPQSLTSGLIFDGVDLGEDNVIDYGVAYIHYLPQGFVQEAVIHLKFGEDSFWSLAIHPLTGRADIVARKISLEEIHEQ